MCMYWGQVSAPSLSRLIVVDRAPSGMQGYTLPRRAQSRITV